MANHTGPSPRNEGTIDERAQTSGLFRNASSDQRVQFAPSIKPSRIPSVDPGRTASVSSPATPRAPAPEKRGRHQRRQEDQARHINIDEHLLPLADAVARYKTHINLDRPNESLGLTTQQAAGLLREHGPNILTPPKKRHPFLKYLDCLKNLFNVLLIVAGVMEYILLAINFRANFANASFPTIVLSYVH